MQSEETDGVGNRLMQSRQIKTTRSLITPDYRPRPGRRKQLVKLKVFTH